jgi:hypothetical protein
MANTKVTDSGSNGDSILHKADLPLIGSLPGSVVKPNGGSKSSASELTCKLPKPALLGRFGW